MTMSNTDVPQVAMVDIESMEPAERRILIAEDALTMLLHRKYTLRPTTRSYILNTFPEGTLPDTPMEKIAEGWLEVGCFACAIGSIFVTAVRRFDLLTAAVFARHDAFWGTYRPAVTRSVLVAYLERFFSEEQLTMIETAFERTRLVLSADALCHTPTELLMACEAWLPEVLNSRNRLVAICENIVRNRGTFDPEDTTPPSVSVTT